MKQGFHSIRVWFTILCQVHHIKVVDVKNVLNPTWKTGLKSWSEVLACWTCTSLTSSVLKDIPSLISWFEPVCVCHDKNTKNVNWSLNLMHHPVLNCETLSFEPQRKTRPTTKLFHFRLNLFFNVRWNKPGGFLVSPFAIRQKLIVSSPWSLWLILTKLFEENEPVSVGQMWTWTRLIECCCRPTTQQSERIQTWCYHAAWCCVQTFILLFFFFFFCASRESCLWTLQHIFQFASFNTFAKRSKKRFLDLMVLASGCSVSKHRGLNTSWMLCVSVCVHHNRLPEKRRWWRCVSLCQIEWAIQLVWKWHWC